MHRGHFGSRCIHLFYPTSSLVPVRLGRLLLTPVPVRLGFVRPVYGIRTWVDVFAPCPRGHGGTEVHWAVDSVFQV